MNRQTIFSGVFKQQGMRLACRLACLALIALLTGAAGHGPAAWSDKTNGIAIGGYDPMSYTTHGKPLLGYDGLEHYWGGTTWRFYNEGNREAFARHPHIYAPRFAGYDLFALSQSRYVEGLPTVWEIYKGRLYFFSTPAARKSWRADRDAIVAKVEKLWPELSKALQDYNARKPLKKFYPSML